MTKKIITVNSNKKDKGKNKPESQLENAKEFSISMGVAIALALLVKILVVELFVIPSGSMEPNLHGRVDGGDRVLCSKLNYHFRDPVRWEPFVFQFPHDDHPSFSGTNFIKRCIGLPGEKIYIRRGDIYTSHSDTFNVIERQIKSDEIQRRLWIPVYEENFSDLSVEEMQYFWLINGKPKEVNINNNTLVFSGSKIELTYRPRSRLRDEQYFTGIPDRYIRRQVVTFKCNKDKCEGTLIKTVWHQKIVGRCPICKTYMLEKQVTKYQRRSSLYDEAGTIGVPGVNSEKTTFTEGDFATTDDAFQSARTRWHFVPDLRTINKIQFGEVGSSYEVELSEETAPFTPDHRFRLKLFADQKGRKAELWNNNKLVAQSKGNIALAPGQWYEVEFYRADSELRLFIDRTLYLNHKIKYPMPKQDNDHPKKTGIKLAFNGKVKVQNLKIDRDIYYYFNDSHTGNGRQAHGEKASSSAFEVTLKGYMAMGDNCTASNDSRNWGEVPEERLRGPALFIWWPPHRIRLIK
jgi:signal peptidase I